MARTITLIDTERTGGIRSFELQADIAGGSFRLPHASVRDTLGWKLKPEGLCRDSVCVPVADRTTLGDGESLDLEALATALDRPLAQDVDEGVAVIGATAADRGTSLASLQAPDFTLPDLSGKLHTLSDHRGKKVLLIVWWLKQDGREEAAERHFERACELGSKDWTIRRGSMPIRGQDPFGPDFFALAAEGAPRYALEEVTPTRVSSQ